MTDLSGIVVSPGIMPAALKESLASALERIGGKMIEGVRLDTTHFVCTEGRGQAWEKAVAQNIPVVVPDWVLGCEREGRIVGVRAYYLGADPRLRQVGPSAQQVQQQAPREERRGSVPETPTTNVIPPTPERNTHRERVNGADEEEETPAPVPPPKEEASESQGTTLAEEPPTEEDDEKAKESPVSPIEDEAEDAHEASPEAENPTSGLPYSTKAKVEDAPEEASFQDVAL